MEINNPYWDIVKAIPGNDIDLKYDHVWRPDWTQNREHSRNELCGKYSWAIPDPDSLAFVAKHLAPKAIEIGAGTGYWASLLAQMGVDMLCYDLNPPQHSGENHYHSPHAGDYGRLLNVTREVFFDVQSGNHEMAASHPQRTLFLCWPPYSESMASNALKAYQGTKLVFIGECEGGCTGDDEFFALLAEQWHLIDNHTPVQWWGIHDEIEVYERD